MTLTRGRGVWLPLRRVVIARSFRDAVATGAQALVAASLAPVCAACRRVLDAPLQGPVCDRCWTEARQAHGRYEGALRHILHAFKSEGRRSLARPLAHLLREQREDVLRDADCVVPVPLHPARWLRRGFNQAAHLARHLGPPVVHALWRTRATPPQAGLGAAVRARNVRGAFRVSPILSARTRQQYLAARVVVIVDDVMTTGSTLAACHEVLQAAGAADVRTLTLARAPLVKPDLEVRSEKSEVRSRK